MNDEKLQEVYIWVDELPLSRPKKNIHRDFSDGVLIAEVIHHYYPHIVELHNYPASHSVKQKEYNWTTLKQKCFKRMGFPVKKELLANCARAVPGAIEKLLYRLKQKLESGTVSRQPRRMGPPTHIARTGQNLRTQQDGGGGGGNSRRGNSHRGPVVEEYDDMSVSSGLRGGPPVRACVRARTCVRCVLCAYLVLPQRCRSESLLVRLCLRLLMVLLAWCIAAGRLLR